ncbi:tRNA uridine-5-carboxymethylaminomethyl(34) synthesis enzyme MnmG [Candidatus Haliotispira prima]|uniref:tRNA uridine 5-carboxymethylaminomethyl modification enzyme MnmG n=1 Tax=Candidatus Haliotispira prima TaxID=3034016 RepID=A0ABY8MFP1_9SPIO|nr:tRNA uridine-5-carboxymethylaminomethyl(34) synthesis enzyme MnmG [Candidatus Haliotispira prima]
MADYQAIVIGGGHAGIESALATARMGFSTLMITQNLDTIGKMSCNPAVGGLGKGNMVREIDALGGQMARLIDGSMVQYRVLNRSRGPAVQAPRAQADRVLYAQLAKHCLEQQANLRCYQDTVTDLLLRPGHGAEQADGREICYGVRTERGHEISAEVVVLTTGTFLNGRIHIGEYMADGGRLGEKPVLGLSEKLNQYGYRLGRLKTGTPARVQSSSLDFSRMEIQPGDEAVGGFSFDNIEEDYSARLRHRPALPCHITYTTARTHDIIRSNMDRSPLFSGRIQGTGPRYCPSIEDKVKRFPDRDRHQVFVEPEGMYTQEMYLNGLSTSLPEDVQEAFIRSIPGMEEAVLMRPGYAVEYDFVNPLGLHPDLESKLHPGLFLAGQINGTSGYEEAASQGLMAGINAGLKLRRKGGAAGAADEALVLSRSDAYIGVLVDDLVTLGTEEPYRMFTSRAEYRLALRHGDADLRLLKHTERVGILEPQRLARRYEKQAALESIGELVAQRKLNRGERGELGILVEDPSLHRALRDPNICMDKLTKVVPELAGYPEPWLEHAVLDIKYAGYIARQQREVDRFRNLENIRVPSRFDWLAAKAISVETRQKLHEVRPLNLGQASRVSGVRPSDISLLMILLDT